MEGRPAVWSMVLSDMGIPQGWLAISLIIFWFRNLNKHCHLYSPRAMDPPLACVGACSSPYPPDCISDALENTLSLGL